MMFCCAKPARNETQPYPMPGKPLPKTRQWHDGKALFDGSEGNDYSRN
jgi:hypothetical protein